jgi:hypothetical protein
MMKRLALMIAFAAIATTALDASNYFPQEGKKTTSKSQTIKAKKPIKKVVKKKALPVEDAKINKK